MSENALRVGLLGLGRAGRFHLKSLRMMDSARLVSVCDLDSRVSQQVAQLHHCDTDESPEQLIARDDVDAVIVATPTDSHFSLVQACLQRQKPVLTEKPLGRHLEEIDESFRLAKEKESPLFVAFQRRFDPSFASLVDASHSGSLGQLHFVRSVSRDNPVPSPDYIRTSGGIFHDCMVHDLDMVVHIVQARPTHVSAFGSSFIREIGELGDYDNVVASLLFENGVTATIDINRQSAFGYDQRLEVFGDGGMLLAENRHLTTLTQASDQGFTRPQADYSFPTRYREAYLAELECFVRCARREIPVPITHEDVRMNHCLATRVQQAAEQREVLAVE